MDTEKSEKPVSQPVNGPEWSALSLAWNLGYTIAIPIIALALGANLFLSSAPRLIGILNLFCDKK